MIPRYLGIFRIVEPDKPQKVDYAEINRMIAANGQSTCKP